MAMVGKNRSHIIDEEEIVEEHKTILDKRNLINSSEVESLSVKKYSVKNKPNELYQEDNPKIMMEKNFAFGNQNFESEGKFRGSQGYIVSTSPSENARRVDFEEAYFNPNMKNDLSQMNISRLSQNDS
jgi:hypothetical protein